jgi:pyruvate, water dikinase
MKEFELEPGKKNLERNDAVKMMIAQLIQTAKQCAVKMGICRQGPSDHSDFAEFLVEQGIDSISITSDSVIKTIKAISAIEKNWLLLKIEYCRNNEHEKGLNF